MHSHSPSLLALALATGLASGAVALAGCSGGDDSSGTTPPIDASSTPDGTVSGDAAGGDAWGGDASGGTDGSHAGSGPDGSSADGALADGAAGADAACDASAVLHMPDLTVGTWVFYNSIDSASVSWDGSSLKFTSMTPSCGGAILAAYNDWKSTNGVYATHELYNGTYDAASLRVSLVGYALQNSQGSVVLDSPTATYDPGTDQLLNGSWTGGHPGTFSARHVIDDGGADAADAASE